MQCNTSSTVDLRQPLTAILVILFYELDHNVMSQVKDLNGSAIASAKFRSCNCNPLSSSIIVLPVKLLTVLTSYWDRNVFTSNVHILQRLDTFIILKKALGCLDFSGGHRCR